MKRLKGNKGLTLIEIVVSIAIMGILAVSFLNLFSGGYISILSMGSKTKAVEEAQTMLENLYRTVNTGGTITASDIETALTNAGYDKKDPIDSTPIITPYTPRFCISASTIIDGNTCYPVTVLVFYNNGQRYVTLTTYIAEGRP